MAPNEINLGTFEDWVRTNQTMVERARAELRAARNDLEVAEAERDEIDARASLMRRAMAAVLTAWQSGEADDLLRHAIEVLTGEPYDEED